MEKNQLLESNAYSLEAPFSFVYGYMENGFGFLWGQKSNNGTDEKYAGFHYFIISASGKFAIRSYNSVSKKPSRLKIGQNHFLSKLEKT